MKKTIITVTTAAALLGAFVCLPAVRGQNGRTAGRAASTHSKTSLAGSAASPGGPKIACLDMGLILREYKKVGERRETAAIAEAGNAKIRQLQAEIQALIKHTQEEKIDQDSDDFRAREKKAYQLEDSMKTCKETAEREMKLQSVKIAAAIYEEVQAALKLFSDEHGYTLILQVDREAAKTDDYRLARQVVTQQVIYNRAQEDISVRVLSYLNNRYQAERAEAGIDDATTPGQIEDQPTRTIPVSPNRKRSAP